MIKKLIGYCGVDSGQLIVCDPCYLSDWKDTEEISAKKGKKGYPFTYAGACSATLEENEGGQLVNEIGAEVGVAVSSGFGDGVYPVYAHIKDEGKFGKRVKKVEIIFY